MTNYDDRSDYARYRAILRETHAQDGMTPFYSFGDGGWCDWTAPEVLFKGEHSLTRTPYGYMPTEAVQEMLRLRGEFDRGGWWTVLAWVAAVRPVALERIEDVRAARDALTAELKRRRDAGYVERVGCGVDYRPGRHGRL